MSDEVGKDPPATTSGSDIPPWMVACVEVLLGAFVAIIMTIVIDVTPIHQAASDLSQRVLLFIGAPGGALGPAKPTELNTRPKIPQSWVLIDLGPNFCGLEGNVAGCPGLVDRTNRRKLAQLLAVVRAKKPRVIVYDVESRRGSGHAERKEDELLLKALREGSTPVLLGWAPSTTAIANLLNMGPDGRPVLKAPQNELLFQSSSPDAPADARYLPSLRSRQGAIARLLTPSYNVLNLTTGATTVTPNIAYAAALVVLSPPDDLWRGIRQFADGNGQARDDACPHPAPHCLEGFSETDRVFSFPVVDWTSGRTMASPSTTPPFFTRLTPTATLEAPDAQLPGELLRDAVVVIGDTRDAQRDRVSTAVGTVSGSEIILNDIRQFVEAEPSPHPSVLSLLFRDVPFILCGGLATLIVHLGMERIWPEPIHRTGVRIVFVTLSILFVSAVFFGVMLAAEQHSFGEPPDYLVVPFSVLLLECGYEFLHRFHSHFEQFMHNVLKRETRARGQNEPARPA